MNISRQKQAADITSVRDKLEVKVVEGIRDRSLRTQCEAGAETAVVREPCSSGQPQLLRSNFLFYQRYNNSLALGNLGDDDRCMRGLATIVGSFILMPEQEK